MIIFILHEGVQRAVDGVILAGLDLNGDGGQSVVVIDQIIGLTLAAVVVIVQIIAVGDELAGDNALIYRTRVDAPLVVQDRANIAAVQESREDTHVVQIELQQILAGGFNQREHRRGDGLHVQRNARANQILELIPVIGKGLATDILDPLRYHALLFVLPIGEVVCASVAPSREALAI